MHISVTYLFILIRGYFCSICDLNPDLSLYVLTYLSWNSVLVVHPNKPVYAKPWICYSTTVLLILEVLAFSWETCTTASS
jgi:hypothetical protein